MPVDKQLCNPNLEKWRAIRAVPYEEKRAALEAAGWTSERCMVKPDLEVDFWKDPDFPDNGVQLSTDSAYASLRYRQEKVEIEAAIKNRTLAVNCNKCGKDLRKYDGDKCVGYYGLSNVEVHGAYWSKHISDTISYKFSLCEQCLAELFLSCKIPIEQELYY